ncbi:unnamed protein product, partial [marine sediment metagenome]
ISVKTFKTEQEALDMANDTTYGLGCKINNTSERYPY